jgi:serine/threonine-protein kinase
MSKREDGKSECPKCGYIYDSPFLPSYLAPGTVLSDRYIIGKLKSYNGESAKYIAFDTITDEKVYVSEYMPDAICSRVKGSPAIIVDTQFVAQYKTLLSEFVSLNKNLSKMRSLNHVAAVTDMFGDNNTGYAVFEYQTAKTMTEYLKENAGEISWEEAKKLIPPLLTTVSLIHNAGIIHRGISPANVLINDKNELILTGFAISEVRTANTVLASEIYTGYAAPEQYNSADWHDTWTDVYGVSALIYRMLTGITPVDALIRTTTDSLVPPNMINPAVPKNVSKAIMHGMMLSHEMRVQNITELVTLLFDQPDYKSERLSSSSTMSIPVQLLKGSGTNSSTGRGNGNNHNHNNNNTGRSTPQKSSSGKKRKSRRRIFFATGGITLLVGLCIMMVVLLIYLPDTDSTTLTGTDVTSLPTSVSSFERIYDAADGEAVETTVTTVTTTVTAPSAIYIMNDITGKNYDIISNSENYRDILFFNPVYEFNDTVPKGDIISQSIPKDGTYKRGDPITVAVSNGPKYVTIPDFVGLTAKDYFTLLNEQGIKYEQQTELTPDIYEGYVVKLSKIAGEQLDNEIGETLIVYVAQNPPKSSDSAETTVTPPYDDNELMIELPFDWDETTVPLYEDPQITYYNY